jgi:NAD(P)H dehydrogenase (quinone)
MADRVLVTGAGGHLGRLVIDSLLQDQHLAPEAIVAGTRKPKDLVALEEQGLRVRHADFGDAESMESAFAGVDRLLLISTDSLGSGVRLAQHKAAIAAAAKAGVKHIVYTSMPNPETSAVTFAADHAGTEAALKASGLGYTILRNSWYQENLLGALPGALKSGQWFSAAGEGRQAHIAREDCARVAAAVLTSPPAGNQTITLTGAKALTTREIAALASEVAGKPLTVIDVTPEQLAGGMKAAGLPDMIIPMLVSFDVNTKGGGFDVVTDAVKRLTGREPQSLKAFFEANKAALGG